MSDVHVIEENQQNLGTGEHVGEEQISLPSNSEDSGHIVTEETQKSSDTTPLGKNSNDIVQSDTTNTGNTSEPHSAHSDPSQSNSQVSVSSTEEGKQSIITVPHEVDVFQLVAELKHNAIKCFERGEYSSALELYKKAVEMIRGENFKKGTEEHKKLFALKMSLLTNLSFCYMHLGEYRVAISYAEKVILTDKDNVKALHCIALCKEKTGEYQNAFDKIKDVIEIHRKKGLKPPKEIYDTYASLEKEVKKDPSNSQLVRRKQLEAPQSPEPKSNKLFQMLFLFPTSIVSYMTVKSISKYHPKSKEVILSSAFLSSLIYGVFVAQSRLWRLTFIVSSGAFLGLLHLWNRLRG